jgi:hypothetical protein
MLVSMGTLTPGGDAEYSPPTLRVIGTVQEITRAQAAGTVTDRSFPAGTPLTSLTFS